ncbi:MAG: c-type cytochrome biogenesis protein CcmI [Betaproteobacteria bacterium]|nr:c-type cytochrome biogenesis protein CcmI [Betaproteobacteria bacterium]
MIAFVAAAAALTLVVIGLITRPLIFAPRFVGGVDRGRLNARLLQAELGALEMEHAKGTIDAAEFARARDELTRRVLEEASPAAPGAKAAYALPTAITVALMLPICAGLLYVLMGTPGALVGGAQAVGEATAAQVPSTGSAPPQVQGMVNSLAAKLAQHPDDPAGWAMLGRSYSVLGRYRDAVAAFGRIGPSLNGNATWLAEYADALSMTTNGDPVGRPEQLALRALKLEPNNLLALMLAGYAASRRGEPAAALPLLERAQSEVAPDSEDYGFVHNLVEQDRAALGLKATGAARGASGDALKIAVSIAPRFRAAARGRTVFVFARAPGNPMPLAAVRSSVDQLPTVVALSDANSLDPGHPLSGVRDLRVEARVSASGDATPQPGDLIGSASLDTSRSHQVAIDIDKLQP